MPQPLDPEADTRNTRLFGCFAYCQRLYRSSLYSLELSRNIMKSADQMRRMERVLATEDKLNKLIDELAD